MKLATSIQYKEAVDFDASRATATCPNLAKYRYVHFATHDFVNSQRPELSGIAFPMIDQQGNPQNGFLRVNEVLT